MPLERTNAYPHGAQVAQAGRDAVLGMAAILVPADVPRLLAALDELACFPDEDVRQSVVIMLAGLTGLLSQRSCTEMLLPRVMRLLEDNAYLVRKVGGNGGPIIEGIKKRYTRMSKP